MKRWYSIIEKSKEEKDGKYFFRIYWLFFIPMILVTDWNTDGIVIFEYKLADMTIFKQKHKTRTWTIR